MSRARFSRKVLPSRVEGGKWVTLVAPPGWPIADLAVHILTVHGAPRAVVHPSERCLGTGTTLYHGEVFPRAVTKSSKPTHCWDGQRLELVRDIERVLLAEQATERRQRRESQAAWAALFGLAAYVHTSALTGAP